MARANYKINVRCVFIIKKTGQQCQRPAIAGAVVCTAHGGLMTNIRKAAAMKLTEAKVRAQIEDMRDVAPITSVGDVYADLLEVFSVCRAWRLILQDRVSYLRNLHTHEETGEQVRADVLLFERSLERSAKIGETLARLNLDERKQALDERAAAQVALVFQAILAELDLTPAQQAKAAEVVPAKVRELT